MRTVSSGSGLRIFSACLFLFPKRALNDKGYDYAKMVDFYVANFRQSVEQMVFYPTWKYRLYLDYSVCMPYPRGSAIAAIAAKAYDEIVRIALANPHALEIVGVRFMRPGYEPGTTFMPSIWRFLPIADPSVQLFSCWDVDVPPHPLFVHVYEEWGRTHKTGAIHINFEDYRPVQCVPYVATHLRDAHAEEHADCLLAQWWASHFDPDGATMFADMVALATDEPLKRFWAEVTQSNADRVRALTSPGDAATLQTMVAAIRREARASSPWLKAALKRDDLTDLAALAVFRDRMVEALPIGSQLRATLGENVSWERLERMRNIVVHSEYGVDEWVQHVMVEHALRTGTPITRLKLFTPVPGVLLISNIRRFKPVPRELNSLLGFLKLDDAVDADDSPNNRWKRENYIKVFMLSGAFLYMFRPSPEAGVDVKTYYEGLHGAYTRRLEHLLDVDSTVIPSLVRAGLSPARDAIFARTARQVMRIRNMNAFTRHLSSDGSVTFETAKWRMRVGSLEGMRTAVEFIVRSMFLQTVYLTSHFSMRGIGESWM